MSYFPASRRRRAAPRRSCAIFRGVPLAPLWSRCASPGRPVDTASHCAVAPPISSRGVPRAAPPISF